jgi:hypothetical protein
MMCSCLRLKKIKGDSLHLNLCSQEPGARTSFLSIKIFSLWIHSIRGIRKYHICAYMEKIQLIAHKKLNSMHRLLDPSCSGSGIVNRLDYLLETTEGVPITQSAISPRTHLFYTEDARGADDERLKKLAGFQLMMIKHAMKCMFLSFFALPPCLMYK